MAKLLWLRSDTTNGDTTFEDSSEYERAISVLGGAQHSTAQKKFNASSMYFDGTGDFLTVPSSTDFDFGTGDFTIHFWVYTTSIPAYDAIIQRSDGWGDSGELWVRLNTSTNGIECAIGSARLDISSLPLSQWNHIAIVRESGVGYIYLNGNAAEQLVSTADINSTEALFIARNRVNTNEEFTGYIEELIIDDTALWSTSFTPEAGNIASAPCPLTVSLPDVTGKVLVSSTADIPCPLDAVESLGQVDYTDLILNSVINYALYLTTPGGVVRVPMSSWQATLQVDQKNFLQCVVPAALPWVTDINSATAFSVYRVASLFGGSTIEQLMATADLTDIQPAQGHTNYSITLRGYADGFSEDLDPPAELDRVLTDVRTLNNPDSGRRFRCAIDWLLRPSRRALIDGSPMVVDFINYYVTDSDEYMDVGERL